jgi:hypothetical protein
VGLCQRARLVLNESRAEQARRFLEKVALLVSVLCASGLPLDGVEQPTAQLRWSRTPREALLDLLAATFLCEMLFRV